MGTMIAQSYCEEHGGMPVAVSSFTSGELLCHIGRIEKATEEALERIAGAEAVASRKKV